jgi:Cell wall hydrolyses involved in spore germination
MKKVLIAFSSLTLFFFLLNSSIGATNVAITMDGKKVDLNAKLINSTTYVPVSSFGKLIDTNVTTSWDWDTRTLSFTSDHIVLTIGESDKYMTANERCLYLPSEPLLLDGYIYVPIRTLAAVFGASVTWNDAGKFVTVHPTGNYIQPGTKYYKSDELYWLSRIISAESKGEPLLGQIAVGNVVLNRKASGNYPQTIHGVIFDKAFGIQFTPASDKSIFNPPTETSVTAAKICLEGTSLSDKALYFLNQKTAKSSWIVKNRGYVMTIGNHSFYS